MPTTGPQLRKERRAADITVTALAARMGVSRQTLHGWERAAVISPEFVTEYRAALRALRDGTGTSSAA